MKLALLLGVAVTARLVSGHAYVWGVTINGMDMGRGDQAGYIRKVHNNDPVKDVKSQDMTCNKNNGPARTSLSIKGGDKVIVNSNSPITNLLTIVSRSLLSGLTTIVATTSSPALTKGKESLCSQRLSSNSTFNIVQCKFFLLKTKATLKVLSSLKLLAKHSLEGNGQLIS